MTTVKDLLDSLLDVPGDAVVYIRTAGEDGKPVVTYIGGVSTTYSGFCEPVYTVYLTNLGHGPSAGEKS